MPMKPTQQQLDDLAAEAKSLLSNWDNLPNDKRFVIEFAGTPKSGKSTCIDIVEHFFRRLEYDILAPSEGASKRTPRRLKEDLVAYNAWSATYALTQILESRYGADKYQLVLMDRGLFDALAWFEMLANSDGQHLTPDDRTTIHKFLLVPNWNQQTQLVFLFLAEPAIAIARENENKLVEKPGITMNPEFLGPLNSAYSMIETRYSGHFQQVTRIQTSLDTTPHGTAYEVTKVIIAHIKAQAGA